MMKQQLIKTLTMLTLTIFAICGVMSGQTPFKIGAETKLIVDGHAEVFWGSDDPAINPDTLHLGEAYSMIRPILKIDSKSWIAEFEPNLSLLDIDNSNWLLRAAVGYKVTPEVSILGGRIMTADIFMTPPARFNSLVRTPRVPTGVYGWGVQMNAKVSDHLNVMWDITTDTSKSFQDEDTFDGFETSLRATYKFNDEWSLSGNVSYDFQNYDSLVGLDLGYKNGPFDVRLVGYDRLEDKSSGDVYGAYLIASYLVNPYFEVHTGFDIQDEHGWSQTTGVRFIFDEDNKIDLRADLILSNGFGREDCTIALSLRKKFW